MSVNDYVKRDKILTAFGKRLNKEDIVVLSKDERQALLYMHARSVYRRFAVDYLEADSTASLEEKLKSVLSKAEAFAQEQKLIDVTYTMDYGHILVQGYKPVAVSDHDLITKHAKYLKKIEKQTEQYRQSKAKNKSEAVREINRLKRKFKI